MVFKTTALNRSAIPPRRGTAQVFYHLRVQRRCQILRKTGCLCPPCDNVFPSEILLPFRSSRLAQEFLKPKLHGQDATFFHLEVWA
jgi:hypothetical protein